MNAATPLSHFMRFELRAGHEVRGFMIRLYPTQEQLTTLHALSYNLKQIWNYLVGQSEMTNEAREAYAVRYGLVPPRPHRPNFDGLEPAEAAALKETHRVSVAVWYEALRAATKDDPACQYRSLKDWMTHLGVKQDYQFLQKISEWKEQEVKPNAHMLQALAKNLLTKSARPKRRKRSQDSMPLQVRSGDCFELGSFGDRRGVPFYDCQVKFGGMKIRGRLPGIQPSGRVLEGVSIVKKADGWWASIKQEVPIRPLPEPVPGSVVGVDAGLVYLASMSNEDGSWTRQVPNARNKEFAERIAGRQALGKDTGRLHLRAARHMRHVIHNEVVKPLLTVETIGVENLSSDIGQRGSTMQSAMLTMKRMVEDKLGARVREVEACFTSQTCSQCGEISKESWSYEHGRMGKCPRCGYEQDRDLNAARNIAGKAAKARDEERDQ